MDKNKKIVYYTSAKTFRVIIILILSIGINVLVLETTPDNSFIWFLVIYHGYLLAWTAGYALDGIGCSGIKRVVLICIMEVLTVSIALVNKKAELAAATGLFSMAALIFYLSKDNKRNGDNDRFDRPDLDDHFFDVVHDIIYHVKVSFPLNIENSRYERGQGYVTAIGRITTNKYAHSYGVLVRSVNGKEYLCPLRQIKPLELLDNKTNKGVTIAGKKGIVEIVCHSWQTGGTADGIIYEL
jgi:hypothetical protein